MSIIFIIVCPELISPFNCRIGNFLGHTHMLHRPLNTECSWRFYIDTDYILLIPEYIIRALSYNDTRFLFCKIPDNPTLIFKYYTHGNYWTNPVNYDMTLNSEKIGIEDCVKVKEKYLMIKGFISTDRIKKAE